MAIIRIGVDLAKNVFAVHGVDQAGHVVLARTLRRAQLLEALAAVPPCVVAMEACSGAHPWARQLGCLGHTVRIIAPKFVSPYRMSGKQGKNDAHDAAAICEAAGRPSMRFVPAKTVEQQALLSVHRVRQGFVEERTATINRLRGLLSEFGVVLPLKAATVRRQAAAHIETLPVLAQHALGDLLAHLSHLDGRIDAYDAHRGAQAGHAAHAAARLRHPSAAGWLRHPHRAGTARPCRCPHDDDLHPRAEGRRHGRAQSAGCVGPSDR